MITNTAMGNPTLIHYVKRSCIQKSFWSTLARGLKRCGKTTKRRATDSSSISVASTLLVASIKQHGQREVVRVRPVGSIEGGFESGKAPKFGFQILSGDRRVAACRALKIEVRCEVIDCGDAQALKEVILGNEGRVDFDPVQRATMLRQMIDGGMPRADAGKVFGLTSESGIKNTLRLSKLPQSIQKLLSDGTIPTRAARAIVPWAEATAFCDHVAAILTSKEDVYALGEFIAEPASFLQGEFETDGSPKAKGTSRRAHGRPMDSQSRPTWSHKMTDRGFEPTDQQLKDLQIVELPVGNGKNPKLERVALNVELFDKLQEPTSRSTTRLQSEPRRRRAKSRRR